MKRRASCLLTLLFGLTTNMVLAAPITLNGITFSEVGANVAITGGSGTGTQADPFVLNESATGVDLTVQIQGLASFGNPDGIQNDVGVTFSDIFFIKKVVTNNTGVSWHTFDHELQSVLGVPSPGSDGLSFAQGTSSVRPFISNKFSHVVEIVQPRDFVNFHNGTVAPGETVDFTYAISHFGNADPVYLRQRPNLRVVPEPATITLLGLGLAGIGFRRKTR